MMPLPVVEGLSQVILPRARFVGGADRLDLVLQEFADCRALGRRPGPARAEKETPRFGEGLRQLREWFPHKLESQPVLMGRSLSSALISSFH